MPTYLLSWNPNNWHWPDLTDAAARVAAGERVAERWSCGNTKVIRAGDRFFLIRLGKTPRGIFGAGYVTSPPFYEPHWDDERRARGDVTLYVMVEFDWLVDPEGEPEGMIPFRYLETEPRFTGMKWRLQKSGARIPDAVAAAVEAEVRQASSGEYLLPTELADAGLLTEGAKKTITVDARERNAKARRRAIVLHGASCTVCWFTFGDYYSYIPVPTE
jgi:5-methylcytosine-specific restriction protein A